MKLGFLLLLCLPVATVFAKTDTGGVKFVRNVNWDEIKAQAKKENKYIFVDCYATWCGPCKAMDKDVFPDEKLGKLFEARFIAVKVQMDETRRDIESVKRWRNYALTISREYKVTAFPTLLFLNPSGELVLKEVGYKSVNSLKSAATLALSSTLRYKDPYAEYDTLIEDFRKGKVNYQKINYMIATAKALNNAKLADSLSNYFRAFLNKQPKKELFKPEYINFIANNIKSTNDKHFSLFFPSGSKVDALMNQHNYSQNVVDLVIKKQESEPIMKLAERNKVSPNWDSGYKVIAKKYGKDFATRGILAARVWWAEYHEQLLEFQKCFIDLVEKYGIEALEIYRSPWVHPNEDPELAIDASLNSFAWQNVCKKENYERAHLLFALKYMKGVVERSPTKNPFWAGVTYDTYANLLFKSGRKKEGVLWEKRALEYVIEVNDSTLISRFKERILKMETEIANSDK